MIGHAIATSRVVESESGVGVGGVACFQLESESESVFKTAGVGVRSQSRIFKLLESESGVGFSKLLESESGVGVGTFVAITDSNVY